MTYFVMVGLGYVGFDGDKPIWSRPEDAQPFASRQAAHLWAKTWLGHDDFVVVQRT